MNIYEKFKQVGRGRRAWFVDLSFTIKPGQTGIVHLSMHKIVAPRIREILSLDEREVDGLHIFTLRLADGDRLVDAVTFRRTNSSFRQVMSATAGCVAYSKEDVVKYLNRTYSYGLFREDVEILDLTLALWGIPDR